MQCYIAVAGVAERPVWAKSCLANRLPGYRLIENRQLDCNLASTGLIPRSCDALEAVKPDGREA
jgi:hypothetical protein